MHFIYFSTIFFLNVKEYVDKTYSQLQLKDNFTIVENSLQLSEK